MGPSFSVLIAAHNVADLIGDAIESALAQTEPPLEVIVCDDGSTDDLDGALAPYRERIVVLRREHGGEASAKNAAVAAARGELAVFLDGDDVFLPRRLEALGALAESRPGLDILTTDAYLVLDGRTVRRCYEGGWTFPDRNQRLEILRRNFIFGHAAVRPELVLGAGGFDESIRWTTDWDLWLRLILDGAQAGVVAEPLALYRLRETSLSADRERLLRGKLATLGKARANPALRPDERPVLERALAAYRRELRLSELRGALSAAGGGTRRRALGVAVAPGFAPRHRLGAVAAALAPGLAGRVLRARAERFWTAAGGVRVDRRGRATAPQR
jgi:glycosyltransferase involved in cell wall biosynthesis